MAQNNKDPLTGLLNRYYLEEELPGKIEAFIQHNTSFTVVMLDLDHFKTVNDIYGHAHGDAVLKDFAHFLQRSTRISDKVIRFGGDEFLCIMPECGRINAEAIFERLIKKCREQDFDGLNVSISVGLASYPDDGSDYEQLFKAADASLYEAKRNGRNRIGSIQKKQISIPIKTFINRRDELNLFLQKINNEIEEPQFMLVNGNVGIGKTRLVKEGLNLSNNYEVTWSDCLLFSDSIAYYVIRELIKYRIKRRGIEIFDALPLVYKMELGKSWCLR